MTDDATPREVGSHAGLGLAREREAFKRWCHDNGHGGLDDTLTPLDRALHVLMWTVWLGAVNAEQKRSAKLRDALQAMVDCSHTMDLNCCARASQLAAAALKA
jgi:hypothetical protein